ncbi:alpha/beta hydrolase [Mycobacterium sp. 21AC1]|uniref:alpha/beta fold hydrolase n=1 Tax=[Mycobacterium] appelbergii TaxID=2939269 RepID=UPI0029392E61|nr:alpha/beta hydrolase [Mycobacterium sp. 21AC1]MDV3127434.1 alpha/beta hydrolase [Mycobacterium sp. 21AC1]
MIRTQTALRLSGGALALLSAATAAVGLRNLSYAARDARRVARAGFTEKHANVGGSVLNYAEGPDNGPPVVLIHGQVTDWRSWSRTLPDLARRHHVFAVDCYGHGGSQHVPHKYRATALAADINDFVAGVVGEPAIIAGHSSGGLIAAVLAADTPALVRAVALEDPPFFSSVLPRAVKTFNYVGLATGAHDFLATGGTDFTAYFLRHAAIWKLFGPLAGPLQSSGAACRRLRPGKPVRFFALPPTFNELFRAMDSYDPRFGNTFYDNSFHDGFDHAETLARISVPAALIHANWSYDDDGVLLAAMSGEDAERARSLLRDVTFHRVDTGHGFHFEDPRGFNRIIAELSDRL